MTKKQIKALYMCFKKPRTMQYISDRLKLNLAFKNEDYMDFFDSEFHEHTIYRPQPDSNYHESTYQANKKGIEFIEARNKDIFRYWFPRWLHLVFTAAAIAISVIALLCQLL